MKGEQQIERYVPVTWSKREMPFSKSMSDNLLLSLLSLFFDNNDFGLSPQDRAVLVRALAVDIVLCFWTRHLILTVPLSTQVYKCVPTN